MPFAIVTDGEIANIFLIAILTYGAIVRWAARAGCVYGAGEFIPGAAFMIVRHLDQQ
jgi:hypothetical protein